MAPQLGRLTDASNVAMLNAIRYEASLDYQNRVPEATQAGIDDTMNRLMNWEPTRNEFIHALIGRIGSEIARTQVWENPLAEFKRGLLSYGDTVMETQVGLIEAHTFDGNREYMEKANFGRHGIRVETNYHTINRREFFPITVSEPLLKRSFASPDGLSGFVSQLMSSPIKSDNFNEFLSTCRLFKEYEDHGGFYKVNIPDVAAIASTEADAKVALRKVRALAGNMKFLSTMYNAAGMPMAANAEEMLLFTTPEFNAALDVNALAAAFNMEKASIPQRIIEIPKEYFNIDGCQAILTTRDFFIIMDQIMENRSQINAAGLSTNFFWHHHQVISASRFIPAVMFTTKPVTERVVVMPKITSITSLNVKDIDGNAIVANTVTRGMTYQCGAVLVTDPVGATGALGLTWTVSGAGMKPGTTISQTGVLFVAGDETATTLTIKASDSNEPKNAGLVVKTLALTVAGTSAPVWPKPQA